MPLPRTQQCPCPSYALVAPYSLRGVDGAPSSAPLKWSEVTRRLDSVGDLFAPALASTQKLPKLP
ncbi:hypothetical protein [Archangium sp.]|uniref:hypothetical protein n=1 Tax=Archangium sp. TaxID=1872627 RepID=UPI002D453283|nr:hypothetical protein [Archangium sp.]HYO56558.1 hypothetical protein [Archangium sp.]